MTFRGGGGDSGNDNDLHDDNNDKIPDHRYNTCATPSVPLLHLHKAAAAVDCSRKRRPKF